MSTALDRTTIQSLAFHSAPCAFSRHFLFRFQDETGARRFLQSWRGRIAHGGSAAAGGQEAVINLALSWKGLCKLGAFKHLGGIDAAAAAFPLDFREPLRREDLLAYGRSDPQQWWDGRFRTQDIHLSLHVYAYTQESLNDTTVELRTSALENNLEELIPSPTGEAITGQVLGTGEAGMRRLHFGYSDGFSQPEVNWDDQPELRSPPPYDGRSPYPRGYFILDEWDGEAQSFPADGPFRELVRYSSYLALAWVYQDVAAFNRFLKQNASRLAKPGLSSSIAEELLAAKLMGRWRDGTPLPLSGDRPNPALATEHFDYAEDSDGHRCPFAAHIRIVNGRDQPLDFANRIMFPHGFPRVIRRGSSYGPPLEGEEDDRQDRGILGMFLCANIKQQFLPLMRWIGKTDFSEVYSDPHGQDPLFGNRSVPHSSNSFTIPSQEGTIILKDLPDFIQLKGVVVMLLPSIPTLARLTH